MSISIVGAAVGNLRLPTVPLVPQRWDSTRTWFESQIGDELKLISRLIKVTTEFEALF